MATKNNPKSRLNVSKTKTIRGKECEPVMFYDFGKKIKYLSAKITKTNDVVCGSDGLPLRWGEAIKE
ncbi:MAG: hypothetical protein LBP39_01140 [Rickettsiales bacterium]|jgi:hypothetical protein|nr:hypothetical protein [Rickettsiales bacterium]